MCLHVLCSIGRYAGSHLSPRALIPAIAADDEREREKNASASKEHVEPAFRPAFSRCLCEGFADAPAEEQRAGSL
jgi:hypothetical protein